MSEVFQIRTRRLILRRPWPDDAAAISAYRGLPEVAKYQSWETFGIEDANRLIADQLAVKLTAPGEWIQLMIVLADSGLIIGDCGIHFALHAEQQVELGITLHPRYQHRGFACEAFDGVLG